MSETKNIRRSLAWWQCLVQCPFSMGLCLEADFIQCFEGNLCPNAEARFFWRLLHVGGFQKESHAVICASQTKIDQRENCQIALVEVYFGLLILMVIHTNWLAMLGMACWHSGNEIDTEFLLAKSWCVVCVCVDVVIFQVTRPGDVIPHKRVFLEHAISHNCLSGDIFVFEVFYCCLCICMSLAIGCQVSVFFCFYVEFPCFMVWNSLISGRYNPAKSTA